MGACLQITNSWISNDDAVFHTPVAQLDLHAKSLLARQDMQEGQPSRSTSRRARKNVTRACEQCRRRRTKVRSYDHPGRLYLEFPSYNEHLKSEILSHVTI